MQIEVFGQHISVGKSLQEYTKGRLGDIVSKYFENAPAAHVRFSKHGHEFQCDIMVNDGTGRHVVIKNNASADEVYHACDLACSKLEKQMRKYKSKLNNHHKHIKLSAIESDAIKYVIAPAKGEQEEGSDEDNPAIIAETATHIPSLSVSEAVMRMDLQNLPALMFKNAKSGRVNVVYYRKDGNISWVDSK
jgi:ribosomal subunit interface protein